MRFRGIWVVIILAAALIIMPFFLAKVTHAQDQGIDQSSIMNKLDQILNSQKAMMDQIASMKEELNIVKIRVTQAQ